MTSPTLCPAWRAAELRRHAADDRDFAAYIRRAAAYHDARCEAERAAEARRVATTIEANAAALDRRAGDVEAGGAAQAA